MPGTNGCHAHRTTLSTTSNRCVDCSFLECRFNVRAVTASRRAHPEVAKQPQKVEGPRRVDGEARSHFLFGRASTLIGFGHHHYRGNTYDVVILRQKSMIMMMIAPGMYKTQV